MIQRSVIAYLLFFNGLVQFVRSLGPKGRRNDMPLKIGRRKLIDEQEEDHGLWFTGNYDVRLVDITIVPALPPTPRKGCSLKSGILPLGATCSPSSTPSVLPSRLPTVKPTFVPTRSPLTSVPPSAGPTSHPSFSPSGKPSPLPIKTPTGIPSVLPSFSQEPSSSNYPSTLPTTSFKPTYAPSKLPTTSFKPTNAPSKSPSSRPSRVPTKFPSNVPSPTPSKKPTSPPSRKPSHVPSASPTSFPSHFPSSSPSNTPSASPSSFPSHFPSSPPSRKPSTTPSLSPTLAPSNIPSSFPSMFPSNPPSAFPSTSPSNRPSLSPSASPTVSQSISASPTVLLFNSTPTTDGNGNAGENSSCIDGPPSDSSPQTQELTFDYNLYLANGSSTSNQTAPLEMKLHKALAYSYLKCQFHQRKLQAIGFSVVEISSLPLDVLSSTPCSSNETLAQANCFVVNGGISIVLLFSNISTAENVVNSFGAFLASEMDSGRFNGGDVVALRFLGFTNVRGNAGQTPDTPAAVQQNGSSSSDPDISVIAGSAAVAAAVLILLIVLFLVYRRKHGYQQEVYLKQEEELRDIEGNEKEQGDDDEETDLVTELNMKSIIVEEDDNSFTSSLKGIQLDKKADGDSIGRYGHVHKCSSSTCSICQNAQRPTFVTADWRDIRAELGPQKYRSKTRQYVADDTVAL